MRWIVSVFAAGLAFAQGGTATKPKPEDYPVHSQANGVAIGAEFMVHSFSGGEQTFVAPDYLVVEVALFPPKGESIDVNAGTFTLRINGKKQVLLPQAPSMVAASLKHPEWQTRPNAQAGIGVGGIGVALGRPAPRTPFPGAPPESRLPKPPRAPGPDNPGGLDPRERVKPEELVVQTALPEGNHRSALSGYLYFAFQGKAASIKSLELLYEDAVLKLR